MGKFDLTAAYQQAELQRKNPPMDLSAIPTGDLLREYRRRAAAAKRPKGRPKVPTCCPKCGAQCESWRAAQRHCKESR